MDLRQRFDVVALAFLSEKDVLMSLFPLPLMSLFPLSSSRCLLRFLHPVTAGRIARLFGTLGLALFALGCHGGKVPAVTWGTLRVVPASSTIYLAGQTDAKALAAAKQAGVVAVINLRAPSETKGSSFDEAAVAAKAGLTYVTAMVDKPTKGSFDAGQFEGVSKAIAKFGSKKVLVYCSSGNRAAAWYASYLVGHQGASPKDAFAKAQTLGLLKVGGKRALGAYLGI